MESHKSSPHAGRLRRLDSGVSKRWQLPQQRGCTCQQDPRTSGHKAKAFPLNLLVSGTSSRRRHISIYLMKEISSGLPETICLNSRYHQADTALTHYHSLPQFSFIIETCLRATAERWLPSRWTTQSPMCLF